MAICDLLLVEERELLTRLNFGCGDLHELATWRDGTRQQQVCRFRTVSRGQSRLKEGMEVGSTLPGEEPSEAVFGQRTQRTSAVLGGVVQIRGTGERVGLVL
jgi:hypothetical protein